MASQYRSTWKGTLSFGMVSIPISLASATEDHDFKFHLLHKQCGSRIFHQNTCTSCQASCTEDDVERGYEYAKGQFVKLSDDEIEGLAPSGTHVIEIREFLDHSAIDPVFYQRTYFVRPQDNLSRPYVLLREALKKSKKVALGQFVFRSKNNLALIRLKDNALLLNTLLWPDEVRTEKPLEGDMKVDKRELDMAIQLVEALARPFEPERYIDFHHELMGDLIQNKLNGKEPQPPTGPVTPKPAADLMEQLTASLQQQSQPKPAPRRKKAA